MLSRFAFDTARDQAVRKLCVVQLLSWYNLVRCDRIGKGKAALPLEEAIGHLSWLHYLTLQSQKSSIILWSCINYLCLKRKRLYFYSSLMLIFLLAVRLGRQAMTVSLKRWKGLEKFTSRTWVERIVYGRKRWLNCVAN